MVVEYGGRRDRDRTSMAKDVGTSEIHRPLLGTLGPGPMYRLNPTLIGPA